ncbi:MAG: phosphopantetheine-binding protein [Desulfococcaceae bacterium]
MTSDTDKNEILAHAEIGPDSPWFSGHFPGDPILPGIAQLGLVFAAIRDAVDKDLILSGVRRVRFRQIIRPDERMEISISPDKKNSNDYIFRINVKNGIACSGIMTVKKAENKGDITDMNVESSEIVLRVAQVMIEELKLEDVTPETFDPEVDLVEEVGIDSMDLATVALVLQDQYGIRIDEDDYPKLTTVRRIAGYIEKKLNE